MTEGKITLVTLRAVSNGALAAASAGKLPDRLKVLGWGESSSVKGLVRLNETSIAQLPQRQRDMGFDKIALDWEHNTVPGSPEFERTAEPRSVAAYGVPRIVAGEGLFLESLEWTPEGKKSALNFADLSPAVQFDDAGNVVFVHSVALTRNGAVEGLSFFNTGLTEKNMSDNKPNTPVPGNFITLALMASALGLAATATEAEVTGKLTRLSALDQLVKDGKVVVLDSVASLDSRLKAIETAGNKGLATLSATIDGKTVTLSAEDVVKLSTRIGALEQNLTAATTANESRERSQIIALFSTQGKVPLNADGKAYSAEDLAKLPVDTLKLLSVNTPVTVPLSARGTRVQDGKKSELKGLARTKAAFDEQLASQS